MDNFVKFVYSNSILLFYYKFVEENGFLWFFTYVKDVKKSFREKYFAFFMKFLQNRHKFMDDPLIR